MSTKLNIREPEAILVELENLRHKKTEINWVMFGYEQNDIVLSKTGTGGLDELKTHLPEDKIVYAVLEISVKGDTYNPIKYMLITWIGPQVPPGVGKARSAGHRAELIDFIKQKIGIAGEFQPYHLDDLDTRTIADKLTRVANNTVGTVEQDRQNMSRSEKTKGNTKKSQVELVDKEVIIQEISKVHKGEATWGLLGYAEGSKDEIKFLKTGVGLESLHKEWPLDKILYCIVSQQVSDTKFQLTTKYLLVTIVGPTTPSLTKARSASHREELLHFLKDQVLPIHSQYQAVAKSDLTEESFLSKLRK